MSDYFHAEGEKAALRISMKDMRNKIIVPYNDIAGEKVLRRILELPEMCESVPDDAVIGLYSPIQMEINLLSGSDFLRAKGMQVALPRVTEDTLVFSIQKRDGQLRPGMFGIMEPEPEAVTLEYRDLYAICLPGLAFDRSGARIGYGKGYYDRYIGQHMDSRDRQPLLVGTGYDFQLLDFIPQTEHDRKLDYIITPSKTIKTA